MSENILTSGFRLVYENEKPKVLGVGGECIVYEGERMLDGTPCAIKSPKPEKAAAFDEDRKKRFFREIEVLQRIEHPNVVRVFGAGIDTKIGPFYAMERLSGETLRSNAEMGGKWHSEQEVAQTIALLARTLKQLLADSSVIHRDLKPDNIFVESGTLKIADFGLAKRLLQNGDKHTTGSFVRGTEEYIAPENFMPGGVVDHRADIYALGCIAYEMLVGVSPLRRSGMDVTELVFAILNYQAKPLRTLRPELSETFEAVIMKMGAKELHDRYQTYDELLADLNSYLGKEEPSVDTGLPRRRPSKSRLLALATLVVLSTVAGIVVLIGASSGSPASKEVEGLPQTPPSKEPPSAPIEEKTAKEDPAATYLANAIKAYGERNFERALTELLVLLTLNPNHEAGAQLAARIVGETWGVGLKLQTLVDLLRTVNKDANFAHSHYLVAITEYVLGKPSKALDAIVQQRKWNASYPDEHLLAAHIHIRLGNFTLARRELADAGIKSGPLHDLADHSETVEAVLTATKPALDRLEGAVAHAKKLADWMEQPENGQEDPALSLVALAYRVRATSLFNEERSRELIAQNRNAAKLGWNQSNAQQIDIEALIGECDKALAKLDLTPALRLLILRENLPVQHGRMLDRLAAETEFFQEVQSGQYERVFRRWEDKRLDRAGPGYRALIIAARQIRKNTKLAPLQINADQWLIKDMGNAKAASKPVRTASPDGINVTTGERQVALVSILPLARNGFELDLILTPGGGPARAYLLLEYSTVVRSLIVQLWPSSVQLLERVTPEHSEVDGTIFFEKPTEPKTPHVVTAVKHQRRVLVYLDHKLAYVSRTGFQLHDPIVIAVKKGKIRTTSIKLAAQDEEKTKQPTKGGNK